MSHSIRRARDEDHARITEIRNAVTENVLGDANRLLVDSDYPCSATIRASGCGRRTVPSSLLRRRHAQRLDLGAVRGAWPRAARHGRALFEKVLDCCAKTAIARRGSPRAGVARRRLLSRRGWQVIAPAPKAS